MPSIRLPFPASLLLTAGAAFAQTWQQATPVHSPSAREGHCQAWDPARQRTVVFGGYDWTPDIHYQDHWEFDGTTWTQRTFPSMPPVRTQAGMCYDEQRGVMVLFGGLVGSIWGPTVYLGDTWEFDGSSWRQVTTSGQAPTPRSASLAYDSVRGVVVLFGGTGGTGLLTDTWEYDGTGWTQRSTSTVPPARHDYRIVFDRRRSRMVIHPGYILGQTLPFETWEFDGVDWRRGTYTNTPPVFPRPAMAYDPLREAVVLVGAGYLSDPETWLYDGTDWRLAPEANPSNGLAGHRVSYDEARGALVLFGGEKNSGPYVVGTNETWELATLAMFETFGASCAPLGPRPELRARNGSLPRAGTTVIAEITNLAPGSFPIGVLGLSDTTWNGASLPRSLFAIGLPSCQQLVGADAVYFLGSASGTASWSLAIPPSPGLHGLTVFAQALVLDASLLPSATTNGAALSVGL